MTAGPLTCDGSRKKYGYQPTASPRSRVKMSQITGNGTAQARAIHGTAGARGPRKRATSQSASSTAGRMKCSS